MKAIHVINNGNKGKLQIGSSPFPVIKSDEVLIKVFAAGVNRADVFQKNGQYPVPDDSSEILGLEVAGQIDAIGSNISSFKKGDKVCAILEGGGYAEFVAVKASQVLPIPDGIDFIQAASIVESAFTCWHNIFDCGKAKKGEKILIHGGASGIGVMAVQMAKAFGLEVYVTAGSDKKCNFLHEIGAKNAINYKKYDFLEEIGKAKIDIVIDIVGGDYFQKNMSVLARYGRLICIAFLGGSKAEVNFNSMLMKNLTIMGTTIRSKTAKEKAFIANKLQKNIWPLIENGKIKPFVDSVFNLEDADKAHEIMEANANIGKIVLKLC